MYVAHLSLTDFRSYAQVELPLEPGITALVGPNGQGKTNLVEALGYVATLGSHRVPTDAALVRAGASRAVVRARVIRERDAGQPRPTLVEVEVTPGKANRARVNGGSPTRARDILGILRTVLFAPEDLSLVKGDPDGRRRFLDDLLVQLTPRIAGRRRGLRPGPAAALRPAQVRRCGDARGPDGCGPADPRRLGREAGADGCADHRRPASARPGSRAARRQGVRAGQLGSGRRGRDVQGIARRGTRRASGESAGLDDGASVELVEAQLLEAVGRLRSKEIERGVSLVGPHRDDLVLTLGGLPAKGYASHGESWSFALALRLASYELLTNGFDDAGDWGPDGEPVLILDDVFAELDARRRERLAELVAPGAAGADHGRGAGRRARAAGRGARRRHGRARCSVSSERPLKDLVELTAPRQVAAGALARAKKAAVAAGVPTRGPGAAPAAGGHLGVGGSRRARPAAHRVDGQRPARPARRHVGPGGRRAQAQVGGRSSDPRSRSTASTCPSRAAP